ncbi:hypothetical protein FRC05_010990 [Tulasnella sp. 425]|nr:hypothetical protein FRC05_010990 [Tulasnella sp. 425]
MDNHHARDPATNNKRRDGMRIELWTKPDADYPADTDSHANPYGDPYAKSDTYADAYTYSNAYTYTYTYPYNFTITYANHSNAYTYAYAFTYPDPDTYTFTIIYSNIYSDPDAYTYSDSFSNPNTYAYSDTYPDPYIFPDDNVKPYINIKPYFNIKPYINIKSYSDLIFDHDIHALSIILFFFPNIHPPHNNPPKSDLRFRDHNNFVQSRRTGTIPGWSLPFPEFQQGRSDSWGSRSWHYRSWDFGMLLLQVLQREAFRAGGAGRPGVRNSHSYTQAPLLNPDGNGIGRLGAAGGAAGANFPGGAGGRFGGQGPPPPMTEASPPTQNGYPVTLPVGARRRRTEYGQPAGGVLNPAPTPGFNPNQQQYYPQQTRDNANPFAYPSGPPGRYSVGATFGQPVDPVYVSAPRPQSGGNYYNPNDPFSAPAAQQGPFNANYRSSRGSQYTPRSSIADHPANILAAPLAPILATDEDTNHYYGPSRQYHGGGMDVLPADPAYTYGAAQRPQSGDIYYNPNDPFSRPTSEHYQFNAVPPPSTPPYLDPRVSGADYPTNIPTASPLGPILETDERTNPSLKDRNPTRSTSPSMTTYVLTTPGHGQTASLPPTRPGSSSGSRQPPVPALPTTTTPTGYPDISSTSTSAALNATGDPFNSHTEVVEQQSDPDPPPPGYDEVESSRSSYSSTEVEGVGRS